MNLQLPLAPHANRRVVLPRPTGPDRATIYTRGGQTLRVPLRPVPAATRGCVGHAEWQLMRWLQRQAAAEPGFPVRVRSVLLVGAGGCPACTGALRRFLHRFRLDTKLRLVRTGPHPAGCGCGCGHCQATKVDSLQPLLGEDDYAPLPSPGIPGGDGRGPAVGNSLHATAPEAKRAAAAEAGRRNAASPTINARFRYRVAHHAAKQPLDAPHYHLIDAQGNQVSGHYFYGRQPIQIRKKDRPGPPPYDRNTAYPGANPATSYSQYRTEWHGARTNKAVGRQRRRLQKGYELEAETQPARAFIHPHIDVYAQYALQRMLRSPDPYMRTGAANMLAAVRAGTLRGIYQEDQREPALRARRQGSHWWQLLPADTDAVKLIDPLEAPMLVFRRAIRAVPARLDEALLAAWWHPLFLPPRGRYGRPL